MFSAKRILCAIAALAMIAGGVAVFYGGLHFDSHARKHTSDEKTMFLNAVNTEMVVDSQGDLQVTEALSYDLGDTDWHGLYQDIILAHKERVENVRVWRADGDIALPFGPGSGITLGKGGDYGTYGYGVVDDPSPRLRIVWNVRDSGLHRFIVRYSLKGAVRNYRDASSLLWEVWGSGWVTGVDELNVSVKFPGRMKLLEPRTDHLQRRVTKHPIQGNEGSFSVSDLPAKNFVELQAAAAPLRGMPREDKVIMPSILKEQKRIDTNNARYAKESAELLDRSYLSFLIPALLSALFGLFVVWLCWLWLGRDRTEMVPAGGTYQYPPEKIPAPVAAKAMAGASTEHLVSSTLLSMLQRDVFRVLPSEKRKEDVAIMNNVGQTRFDGSALAPWEVPIAELLQAAIDKHERHAPDFLELKKNVDASTAETRISEFEKALKAEMPKYQLKTPYRGRVRRWFVGIVAAVLYGIAVIAIFGGGNDASDRWDTAKVALFFIGFAPVLLWAAIEGNAFYRLKDSEAERVRKWETYQDFFKNMDLSRDYPMTVEIWDEALIYAAAFGYAEKVITKMPRPPGQQSNIGDGGLGWIGSSGFAVSAFDGMSSGISGVTGLSTSSSSGGSSGGGSGGGGGGGW